MDNFPARIPIPPFLSSSFLFLLLRVGRSSIYVAFVPCIDWKREGGSWWWTVLALTLSILLTVHVYLEFKAR